MIWLEFELANYKVTAQHFNHYATETPFLVVGGLYQELFQCVRFKIFL